MLQVPYFCAKPFPLGKVGLELDPLLLGLSGLGLHHVPRGSRLLQLLSGTFVNLIMRDKIYKIGLFLISPWFISFQTDGESKPQ